MRIFHGLPVIVMNRIPYTFLGSLLLVSLSVPAARAAPQVVQDSMGPEGDSLGFSVSPSGEHVAVLANKGSHLEVLYDNVPGPRIDTMQSNVSPSTPFQTPTYLSGEIPVVFSDDSAHWAYLARTGDEYIVMRDGQELARGSLAGNVPAGVPLLFSAKGQHLFYSTLNAAGGYQLVVDGKPGPVTNVIPAIFATTDGMHYAYVGPYTNAGAGTWTFVDGRQVNFFGDQLQYTGRNVLLSSMHLNGGSQLLLNAKPEVQAYRLSPMWISPDGAEIAIVVTPNATTPSVLTVNGKMIDGTQGLTIEKVYFSPDGKRWAALCDKKTGTKFMIVDGQKGDDYAAIPLSNQGVDNLPHWRALVDDPNPTDFSAFQLPTPGFTGDSSKFVYVAQAGGRAFMIVDGAESDSYQAGYPLVPFLTPTGHHIALFGVTPAGKERVVVDGAEINYGPPAFLGVGLGIKQLTFSPGAEHYAFQLGLTLFLDGVAQPGQVNTTGNYVFSPDGKHVAYPANTGGHSSVIVDGKDIRTKPGMVNRIFFSPDSQHIYWMSAGNWAALGTKDNTLLFVDGEEAAHFMPPSNGYQIRKHFTADGALSFVAVTDGAVKRFKVTSGTTLAAVVAAAPAAKKN